MKPRIYKAEDYSWVKSADWRTLVYNILFQLGVPTHLDDIVKKYVELCKLGGRKLVAKPYYSIAGNLETNSSESKNWKRIYDLFYWPEGKGTGIWAIRQ